MTTETNKYQDQSLFNLTWPLFIEISLHMSVGILATLILSGYSDYAVAGVGVANQIMNIFILIFNVTAIGATILIGQNLGANKIKDARSIARSAFGLNFWIGILMTIIVFLFGGTFLKFYGLSGEVYQYALTFLAVTGLSLCIEAVALSLSAILRSHGHTRETMFVTIIMNVISIIGFFIAINGFFGIPVTGVVGVSVTIIIARIFLLFALLYFVKRRLAIKFSLSDLIKIDKTNTKNLMSIGVPSAGEQLSYQLSQVVITSFVAIIGDAALAARVYILNISMFCFMFSMAISQGTQILVARYIGAKLYEKTLKRGLKTLRIAFLVAVVISFIIAFTGDRLLNIFTGDPMIIAVAIPVLWAIIFIEPGRAVNMVLMGSLKSVGDVRFPVIIGIISMWGIAVTLSYVFGIALGLGLLGVWLAQGVDEWFRGVFAYRRWKSQPWLKKKIKEEVTV
ncbi:MATE family efflux transporter [Oceanobacillus sp. CAU 1775]